MTVMNNEDPADPSAHELGAAADVALPEPVAWVRDWASPQPHCVTSRRYRSAADVDAGVRYEPIYTADQIVDRLRDERDTHARWRQDMADLLGECERARDALGVALNKAMAIGEMLAAVVQGAKEEFVRVPYGASHEDVAAINDWHKMAAEALAKWENKA